LSLGFRLFLLIHLIQFLSVIPSTSSGQALSGGSGQSVKTGILSKVQSIVIAVGQILQSLSLLQNDTVKQETTILLRQILS